MRKALLALTTALILALYARAQGPKFKVLHNFGSSEDGTVPAGPLLLGSHGNLYGVTGGGPGEYGNGLVFELSPQKNGGWGEKILHSFKAGSDGGFPWGGLLIDNSGNLYGTLQGDLSYSVGGVFELSPSSGSWSNAVLYTPYAGPGLVFDQLGDLYGTIGGGDSSLGAVGELSPGLDGWNYTQLYSFCPQYGCADGWGMPAPPTWDRGGNLWGLTTFGGNDQSSCMGEQGCGVIFAMTPNSDGTWTYHVAHRFGASKYDGERPYGSLVVDSAGNFYGGTWLGGRYNNGTIFKFSHATGEWKETILYDFPNCRLGCQADGTLAIDSAGNLYGTADGGTGDCDGLACGVVFKLAPQINGTWKYSVLYNLNATSGGVSPFYGVILDSKGNLYGVTSTFGQYGGGTAFEITP